MGQAINLCVCVGLLACSAGCGAEGAPASEEQAPETVSQGAQGSEIRIAYEYLQRFGYFPNAELERGNPHFRAMAPAPADPEVFDENLAAGLRKFQKNAGIDVTGELDPATRALIGRPRCGVIDEDPDAERDAKWAMFSANNRWNTTQTDITYRISTAGCGADCLPQSGVSTAGALSAIRSALASWESWTYAAFTEVTAGGDIVISFVSGLDSETLAQAAPPGPAIGGLQGPIMQIHKDYPFADQAELKDTIIHEFGHVMNLRHTPEHVTSAGGGATLYARMYPFLEDLNFFLPGDTMGASVALGVFDEDMGMIGVLDADANGGNNSWKLWALNANGRPQQFASTRWIVRGGIVGTTLAVCPDDTAWVVRSDGGISAWQASNSSWVTQPMPAGLTARAVGCSEGDPVNPFIVYAAMSDGKVYYKNIATNGWTSIGGPGGTINEVDAGADFVVYALKSNGELWSRNAGVWSRLSVGPLKDIGVGGDAYLTNIWGVDANGNGVAWAKQASAGSEGAIARWELVNDTGPMKRITAARDRAFTLWGNGRLYGRTGN